MDANTIVGLLAAMTFSAFFSGMEKAFLSSDKLRLEVQGKPGLTSSIISYFHRHSGNFISTMLAGNSIALVVCGILMVNIIGNLLSVTVGNGLLLLLLQVAIPTLIILLAIEFLPMALFRVNPDLMLRIFAVPLAVAYAVLRPVSWLVSCISCIVLRCFGVKVNTDSGDKVFSKVDLDDFVTSSIENAADAGNLDSEVEIFHNALDFTEVKIRDCAVPRTEIVAVDVTATRRELMDTFVSTGISKTIVYDGNIDNVVGYIHSSEMFRNQDSDWARSVKPVPIVPETMAAQKLMKTFMQQKKTIAVVVDEFGGTSGIVTMEDLVEEIFGDIEDEHDNTNLVCKQVGDNEYVLSGRVEIEKANETFGLGLPESDDYLTVGGLILDKYQSFPKLNEEVRTGKFLFKILKVTATKIDLVRLKVVE